MHVQDQRALLGHCRLVAGQAVDEDRLRSKYLEAVAHALREFAGRHLGRIDLHDSEFSRSLHPLEVDSQALRALYQESKFLVEYEHRNALSALDRVLHKCQGDDRFAGARGTKHQDAGAPLDAAAEKRIERLDVRLERRSLEFAAVFRRHEPRKHAHAARFDDEVVVTTPETLSPILEYSQPAAVGAVFRRQLLESDDAMRDAMDRPVLLVGRQVIEHQDRAVPLREKMLQREDLPAIAKRALREQPDFRRLSSTTRSGFEASNASKMRLVVSPSSRSDE